MSNIIIPGGSNPGKRPQGWARIEKDITLVLMRSGVTGPEIDECIQWAFGKDAWYKPIFPDWMERWNKLHPGYFKITKADKLVDMIFVVGRSFLDWKKKNTISLN